jgi:chromosome segregation ATPase
MPELLKFAASLSPTVLLLLVLLFMTATAYRVVPMVARRLTTKVETERTAKLAENVEDVVIKRLLEQFSAQFFQRDTERGKKLHQIDSEVTALNLRTERHEREIIAIRAETKAMQEQLVSTDKRAVEFAAALHYQTEKLDEACIRLAKLEEPVMRIDAWVEMRRSRRGEDTP